ncbi:MAG: serine hydrolase [Anaerolineales bacterium]|nr:serine hydrolase [Anaerolineales bacterium]
MGKRNTQHILRRMTRREFLGLAGLSLAAACAPAKPLLEVAPTVRPTRLPRTTPVDSPNGEWPSTSPALQGIDPAAIDALREKIGRESLPVHSFLLARNGFLVSEQYFPGFTRDIRHPLADCTMSVVSALIGIAIRDGFIQNVDQKILDFFPERQAAAGDKLTQLTIGHLLTMTVGHGRAVTPDPADAGKNWTDEFFGRSFSANPGTVFQYDPLAAHMLSAVVQKAAGKPAEFYLRETLFDPMGIKDFTWPADSQGVPFGNTGMELRPIDMAKFGLLFVNDGDWNGKPLIPREWVMFSTEKYADTTGKRNSAEDVGYGYLWWMNSFEGYSAHGAGGQYIYVIPGLDVVAVFTGAFDEKGFTTPNNLMRTLIIPGI